MSVEDSYTRHNVFVQRFAGGQVKEASTVLLGILNQVDDRLLLEPTEFQAGRLTTLKSDINFILSSGFEGLTTHHNDMIVKFSESEAVFAQKALQIETSVILSTPAAAQITAAVFNTGMDVPIGPGRLTISEALGRFGNKKAFEINQIINDGILFGDTTKQVAANVSDMVKGRHRAQLDTLTRTVINSASNQAHKAVNIENSSLLDGEEWVSALDVHTTLICAGRDGRVYPVGRGPYPPALWNCRSVRVPKLKPEFDLIKDRGTRASKGAKGGKQVGEATKFDSWLRGQPANFQDEYFSQFTDGKEKAKLFRIGKLPIQSFRTETGVNLTLDQLKALVPVEIQRGNLI